MFVLNGVLVKVVSGSGFIVEVVSESKSKQLTYSTATTYCELLVLLKGESKDTVKEVITTHEAVNSVVSMIVNNNQLLFNVTHVGCLREELTNSI